MLSPNSPTSRPKPSNLWHLYKLFYQPAMILFRFYLILEQCQEFPVLKKKKGSQHSNHVVHASYQLQLTTAWLMAVDIWLLEYISSKLCGSVCTILPTYHFLCPSSSTHITESSYTAIDLASHTISLKCIHPIFHLA